MRVEELLLSLADSLEAGVAPAVLARSPTLSGLPPAQAHRIARGFETGASLAATLGSLDLLPPASVAILRAAEAHGGVPAGLRLVAGRIVSGRKDAGRALLLLAYPAVLLLAAATILPLPALVRGGIGAWASRSLPLAAAVVVGGALLAIVLRSRAPWATALRASVARLLPFVRNAVWMRALADFAEVLAACLGAGLPARASLALSADAAGHPAIAGVSGALVARLDAGASLVEILGTIPRFPPDLLGTIHAAEHAGTLQAALGRVAETCRQRSRRDTIVALVVLTVVVMAVVCTIVAYGIVQGFADTLHESDEAIEQIMRER